MPDAVDPEARIATAASSDPIRQVPTGCRFESPLARIALSKSASLLIDAPGRISSATNGAIAGCWVILRASRIPAVSACRSDDVLRKLNRIAGGAFGSELLIRT